MTVPARTLEFWYDFNSPDSHPVAQVIGRRAADLGVAVVWKPFRVGPLERRREEREDMPPADPHEVQEIYWRNFVHSCDQAGVQGLRPTMFPKDSIPALRAAVACGLEGLDPATFARAVFDACYAKDWDIADPTVLGEILVEIDYDAARVLERANALDARAQIDSHTAEALRQEFYGAPTLVTPDGELHWGYDGLPGALRAAAG